MTKTIKLTRCVIAWAALGILSVAAPGMEWPGYRGPTGDGITTENISTHWPASGPKVVWSVPLGPAFGSFAVGGDKAFVFAKQGEDEACFAFDANSGKPLWASTIGRTIHDNQGGDGPRSTPSIDGDRVYVLGTYLRLVCLSANDGREIWSHDLKSEFGGREPHWGNAASPLIEGNIVVVAGGGPRQTFLGFDKTSGQLLWKTGTDRITHATATSATIDGVKQDIFFTQSGLVSLDPQSGKMLWTQDFPFSTSTAASPVVENDVVYCSAGYGVGAGAFRITQQNGRFVSTQIWRLPGGDINHWSTPIVHNGYVYGLFGFKEFGRMPLKCIDLATGEVKWSHPGFGQGGLVMVGDNLLVQGDAGQLTLVRATPEGYQQLSLAHPLYGKCWTMPVVANGRIYTRSTKQGVCLDVSGGATSH